MKITELIKKLDDIRKEHGDIDVYEYDDGVLSIYKGKIRPKPNVQKVFYTTWGGVLSADMETPEEDLYDVDLKKSVSIGVIL